MKDEEKFSGFKRQMIEENEIRYGEEARRRYGEKAVDESNARLMGMTKEQYDEMQQLAAEIQTGLEKAVTAGLDPAGEEGRRLAALHRQWLGFTWTAYSKEAHRGLAEMYTADDRFRAHYDKNISGCAEFLRSAIVSWLEQESFA